MIDFLENLGARAIGAVDRLGFASRFLLLTLRNSGMCFRRFSLVLREIYFAGVLSLIIILVSGLFVGMVLGLQGYDTLERYGSSSALGVLVALSLVRELGPVVSGLSVRQPRRLRHHRGNRADEGDRAAGGHGNDGGGPDRAGDRAALLGRRHFDAAAGGDVFRDGRVRRLPGRRAA